MTRLCAEKSTSSVLSNLSVCDTMILKNGEKIAIIITDRVESYINYRKCDGGDATLKMPLSDIVEIRNGQSGEVEKISHDEWLTSNVFNDSYFFRQFKIKTYDTLVLKNGEERIVYVAEKLNNHVNYRDIAQSNTSLSQIELAQIDTIKYRAKTKTKFGHKAEFYTYNISYPKQTFYVDLSFGIGRGYGENRWTKWTDLGFSTRLSTGYQYKPALGLGISYLSSTYFSEPRFTRLRSLTLDYRVKVKDMAFFTHFGFVSKLSIYTEDELHEIDISKSRPTMAFTWAIYNQERVTFGVNFMYSKFTKKITYEDFIAKVTTYKYTQEFDNNLTLFVGWHFPTFKRYKKVFLNDK